MGRRSIHLWNTARAIVCNDPDRVRSRRRRSADRGWRHSAFAVISDACPPTTTTMSAVTGRLVRAAQLVAAGRTAVRRSSTVATANSSTSSTSAPSPLPVASTSAPPPAKASGGSNPAMSFPCVDQIESRTALLQERQAASRAHSTYLPNLPSPSIFPDPDGPEPAYTNIVTGYSTYDHPTPFHLDYGGHLPSFSLAYETWGTMNADASNVILVHTGLSASSHAHSTPENPAEGWWEKFIGSGLALDTDKFFVICTNVLGGCYGSTGPSSRDPSDGKAYATRFPVLSIFDMVRAQFHLLTHLGVDKLYASVGSSMGGMQSIAAAYLEPERVGKVVSISGTARSSPASIAMRHAQRSGESLSVAFGDAGLTAGAVLMADPNWKRGFYYDDLPPHTGMKLARRAFPLL